MRAIIALAGCLLAMCAGCARPTEVQPNAPGSKPHALAETPDQDLTPSPPRAEPPPEGVRLGLHFPEAERTELESGLKLRILPRHTLPLVLIRLVIFSGSAEDGTVPGLAQFTGQLIRHSGAADIGGPELAQRIETLGSPLHLFFDRDTIALQWMVTRENLGKALELLGALVSQPRFSTAEFQRLKQLERERLESLAKAGAGWAIEHAVYQKLFGLPSGVHPYASVGGTIAGMEGIQLSDCRGFVAQHFLPNNAAVLLVGDVEPSEARHDVEQAFANWKRGHVALEAYPTPAGPARFEVLLLNRQQSNHAEIALAMLAAEPRSPEFVAMRVVEQVLGADFSGRLYRQLYERGFAYLTGSELDVLAQGPSVLRLNARTSVERAPAALGAMLAQFERIATEPPSEAEVRAASRWLSDGLLLRSGSPSELATSITELDVLGRSASYYEELRNTYLDVTRAQAAAVAQRFFKKEHAVAVVSGDAKRLFDPLRRFGPVSVLNPERNFAIEKRGSYDPTLSLDVPD